MDFRPSRGMLRILCAGMLAAVLGACSSSNGGDGTIDPSDADSMAQALGVKFGDLDMLVEGGDPPPSDPNEPDNPSVENLPDSETAEPGESKSVNFDANAQSGLAAIYAKVSGSSSYFEATVAGEQAFSTKQNGSSLELVFEIPANLGAGEFCVEVSVEDDQGRVSATEVVCFVNQPGGAVLDRLQGNWERCDDGVRERFVISGNTVEIEEADFDNPSCDGEAVGTFNDVVELEIGSATTSDEGIVVNPLDATVIASDDPDEVGLTFFDIVFVDDGDNEFRLGVTDGDPLSPEQRPTSIDFQKPGFLRVDAFDDDPPGNGGGPGDGGDVQARMQGVWEFCNFGFNARLIIEGNQIEVLNRLFENENCTGDLFLDARGVLSFTVGPALTTTGGQEANELDLVVQESDEFFDDEVGDTIFDIIWIDASGTQLVTGDDPGDTPEQRPDTLDFDFGAFDRVQ